MDEAGEWEKQDNDEAEDKVEPHKSGKESHGAVVGLEEDKRPKPRHGCPEIPQAAPSVEEGNAETGGHLNEEEEKQYPVHA